MGSVYSKCTSLYNNYLQTVDDGNANLEDYNSTKKKIVLTVFDGMIADIEANKELSATVTELLQSLAFILQYYINFIITVFINFNK